MSLYILDALLWIVGIRGHIPGHDDFGAGRHRSPFAVNAATLLRILAAAVTFVAVMTLALWAAVWLAIRLL